MLTSYKSVIKKDHSFSTFGFGILGRLPLAMNSVGLVFLISSVRKSFALAGLASSFYFAQRLLVLPFLSLEVTPAPGGVGLSQMIESSQQRSHWSQFSTRLPLLSDQHWPAFSSPGRVHAHH